MNKSKNFSDEFLNAFVDDQLTAEEKSRAYLDIGADPHLGQQVCELRSLQDMVRLAYRDVPPPVSGNSGAPRRAGLGYGIAASVLLLLGIAIGTQLAPTSPEPAAPAAAITATTAAPPAATARRATRPAAPPAKPVATVVVATPATTTVTAPDTLAPAGSAALTDSRPVIEARTPVAVNAQVRNKVLIHIAHDDPRRLGQALDEISGLLRYYRDSRQSAHVEVVVNGRGLELLRIETSRHAEQIRHLQNEYRNLTFAACQNTIDRLKQDQGVTVRLLPGVTVIDSGMAEIMRRQNQGWTYLQV